MGSKREKRKKKVYIKKKEKRENRQGGRLPGTAQPKNRLIGP